MLFAAIRENTFCYEVLIAEHGTDNETHLYSDRKNVISLLLSSAKFASQSSNLKANVSHLCATERPISLMVSDPQ